MCVWGGGGVFSGVGSRKNIAQLGVCGGSLDEK